MFKIECYVDDKHLAKVMYHLDGLAIDLKVVPIRNAVKQNGKLKSTAAGSLLEAVTAFAKGRSAVSTADLPQVLEAAGFAASSVPTAISAAIAAKVLKKGKARGEYVVLNGGTK